MSLRADTITFTPNHIQSISVESRCASTDTLLSTEYSSKETIRGYDLESSVVKSLLGPTRDANEAGPPDGGLRAWLVVLGVRRLFFFFLVQA
jgi:hypothetical protein